MITKIGTCPSCETTVQWTASKDAPEPTCSECEFQYSDNVLVFEGEEIDWRKLYEQFVSYYLGAFKGSNGYALSSNFVEWLEKYHAYYKIKTEKDQKKEESLFSQINGWIYNTPDKLRLTDSHWDKMLELVEKVKELEGKQNV